MDENSRVPLGRVTLIDRKSEGGLEYLDARDQIHRFVAMKTEEDIPDDRISFDRALLVTGAQLAILAPDSLPSDEVMFTLDGFARQYVAAIVLLLDAPDAVEELG
jgi:hypothetical protein